MSSSAEEILGTLGQLRLVYCDYIGARIRESLGAPGDEIIASVSHVRSDLHPRGGYLVSTTKTLEIRGRNGRRYRVTVEEVE